MNRRTLLRSVALVTLFWWCAGLIVFSFSHPASNLAVIERLADIPFVGERFAALHASYEKGVDAFDSLQMQSAVLQHWTFPMLALTAVAIGLGSVMSWIVVGSLAVLRRQREKGRGEWRGLRVTIGEFPSPLQPSQARIELNPSGAMSAAFEAMPPAARELTEGVLAVLAAHPETYVGDGHGDITLLDHTLNVMQSGLEIEDADPLLPAVLAAHDLGKITSFKQVGGKWVSVRLHDKESARLLALLPAYALLSDDDRDLIRYAVRYSHSMWEAPELSTPALNKRLNGLIKQAKAADGTATAEEKSDLLKNLPLPELVLRSFTEALYQLPFQTSELSRGVHAAAWRDGARVYIIEHKLRDRAIELLPNHARAALGDKDRSQKAMAPYTLHLLRVLNEQGWLVKRVGEMKLPTELALWAIQAGEREFHAVIIVDLPKDMLSRLSKNTQYAMTVLRPQVQEPGTLRVIPEDFPGFKSTKPKKKKTAAGAAESSGSATASTAGGKATPAGSAESKEDCGKPNTAAPKPGSVDERKPVGAGVEGEDCPAAADREQRRPPRPQKRAKRKVIAAPAQSTEPAAEPSAKPAATAKEKPPVPSTTGAAPTEPRSPPEPQSRAEPRAPERSQASERANSAPATTSGAAPAKKPSSKRKPHTPARLNIDSVTKKPRRPHARANTKHD